MVDRLQDHKTLLNELFEQAPTGIALVNSQEQVVRVNREFTRMFGYTPSEVLGHRLADLINQSQYPPYWDLVMRGQRVETETVRLRKDGSRLDVLAVVAPFVFAGGETAMYAIYRDITERKRADDALRELSGQLLRLQDEERRHLARELHDSTAQKLAALAMNLSVANKSMAGADAPTRNALAENIDLTKQCLREIRTLAYLLHPPELEEWGLPDAALNFVNGFAQRSGIPVELDLPSDLGRLPPEVETALFRILQESLNNVHRHSGSPRARVQIYRDQAGVTMQVQDEGQGMQHGELKGDNQLASAPGVGIAGMRERVRQLGGQLDLHSTGSGTTLKVTLPPNSGSL
jgi:PAS domain S-box-containing protein